MNAIINNKKNIDILYWYLITKIISITLIIIFLPIIFEKNYFYSNDFYNLYILCEFRSPNYLFSIITCFLKIKNLTDIQALLLSGILSFLKDFIFLIVASNYLKKNYIIFFCFLLAAHPYLNLYYLKFTPDLINNLMISLYFYLIMTKKNINSGINIIFVLGSMMRNSLIPFFVSYYVINIYKKIFIEKKIIKNKFIIIEDLIFILILGLSLFIVESDYGSSFLSSNKNYDLNLNFFLKQINSGFLFFDYFLAIILNLISHLILLMGFREKAYTQFLDFFSYNNEFIIFYLFFGIFLFLFHFVGLLYILKKFIKSNIYIISFLIFVLPHLFFVTHLRYYMPLMPVSILGVCLLIQSFFHKEKN